MQNWPRVEEQLVKELEKLYPPLEYQEKESLTSEQFTRDAARRQGQRDVVQKLRSICEKQRG